MDVYGHWAQKNRYSYEKLAEEFRDKEVFRLYGNNLPGIMRDWRSRKFDYCMNLDGSRHEAVKPTARKAAPCRRAVAIQWKGIRSASFRHPAVSDYVLPHLLALSTLIVGTLSN